MHSENMSREKRNVNMVYMMEKIVFMKMFSSIKRTLNLNFTSSLFYSFSNELKKTKTRRNTVEKKKTVERFVDDTQCEWMT